MIRKLSIAALLLLGACATRPVATLQPAPEVSADAAIAMAALCSADAAAGKSFTEDLKLSSGVGTGGFKVDSTNPEAQRWFNFGLALSHSFYHEDAKVAMRKAREADPTCSVCAWGEAFALGPTLNTGMSDTVRAEGLAIAERALTLAKDDKARRLAQALVARYQKAEKSTEPAFGQTMAKIAADYPDELELSVVATHALLIPYRSGDRSGLKPALEILEKVLARAPNDTGAIHYYIHATEFDGRAEDALPYAKRLGDLAPMASHLVHMPAHTFFRAGLYQEAAVVNAEAIGADVKWVQQGGDARDPAPMYYAHNLQFGVAGALMAGDEALALKYADHAPKVWPMKAGTAANNTVARAWVAYALYAPDKALAIPEQPKGSRPYLLRGYARGEAFVRKGDLAAAKAELDGIKPGDGATPENLVAHGTLAGRIAMAEGDYARAATLFAEAAQVQDTRMADFWDPPTWWYPVRRSVAAAHLAAGDAAKAAEEAEKSLRIWKHDPVALMVLGQAEQKLGRASAQARLAEARRIWRGDLSKVGLKTV